MNCFNISFKGTYSYRFNLLADQEEDDDDHDYITESKDDHKTNKKYDVDYYDDDDYSDSVYTSHKGKINSKSKTPAKETKPSL